jgi:hypothetical protein
MDFYIEWPSAYFGQRPLELGDANCFPQIVEISTDLGNATAAPCMYLASHEHLEEPDCQIIEFLHNGADQDAEGYRITLLQIAVYRLDLGAVLELIHFGANVNGVGDPDGDVVLAGRFDFQLVHGLRH